MDSTSLQHAKDRLAHTLLLNGHVTAPVLEEIIACFENDDSVGCSSGNENRKWMRKLRRDIQLPGLYHADVQFAKGVKLHPFRLPSVKIRELWYRDNDYFNFLHENVPGRIETSQNWKEHTLFKRFGLKAVPLTMYGDAVSYISTKYGKSDSLVCMFFTFPHRLPVDGSQHSTDFEGLTWMDEIHVFTVFRKADLHQNTWNNIWDVLKWDLKALAKGVFNEFRHDQTTFSPKDLDFIQRVC